MGPSALFFGVFLLGGLWIAWVGGPPLPPLIVGILL